ncbi:GNAT family N-acetyltransferase [Pseudobacteroides cellulosolvens]|uniref:N-acetyltransferase domain-containing protein n=1 Tax=Pseudobacteroides cellulosolvens ATCC 35603 = DSM 2933 TaxID=398512 RepID=A0A0L6JH77_9FIRM|nr:GNAT family N-acetyltransferase [Pseudobacteroides cellulosolvens]KNY25079.1 hypothetical protein Bccel_0336 [Pseudobacteroides cellulosolvens ATCC 35603 = DSM 2933]
MLSMNIRGEYVYLRDISFDDLEKILTWYSKVEHFKYATGRDMPVEISDLVSIYEESVKSESEFFAGIYKKKDSEMIGIIKGKLEIQNKRKVFVRMVVIDQQYQRKGYGRETINLGLSYLKNCKNVSEAYLAVIEENVKGRCFWKALGFNMYIRKKKCVKISNKQCNVIIMKKNL